jgi:hypothetical protein
MNSFEKHLNKIKKWLPGSDTNINYICANFF